MNFQLPHQLLLAVTMFAYTIGLQMIATIGALVLRRIWRSGDRAVTVIDATVQLGVLCTCLLLLVFLQALGWALMYLGLAAFDTFHQSLFFSLSCFSTLGFAGFLPPRGFDILAAMEGVIGSLAIAWSAAIVVAAAHVSYLEFHQRESRRLEP